MGKEMKWRKWPEEVPTISSKNYFIKQQFDYLSLRFGHEGKWEECTDFSSTTAREIAKAMNRYAPAEWLDESE